LPAVRGIGFAVPERGCVTVSMNLVDFEVTGLRTAFDAVSDLARARRMDVLDSEIVGLVPQAALGPDDATYLRLEGFDADTQILERLVSAGSGIATRTIDDFLRALASDAPTPGGGAVAGLAGASAAALISMVCSLTVDKPKFEDAWDRMREIQTEVDEARGVFLALADRDTAAFDDVMAAFKLPKDTDEQKAERSQAIQRSYEGAARVPLEVAQRAVDLIPAAITSIELGNPNAASDGLSGAQMLNAAAQCAIANVQINAAGLKDETVAASMDTAVKELATRAQDLLERAMHAFAERV
jgi:formiminotetrahydrofolate cyclodeaminase